MREYNFDEMCACAKREVRQRERVYRRLVASERMTQEEADREIGIMKAIAEHFERISQPELL